MCNCGNKRTGFAMQQNYGLADTVAINASPKKMWADVSFIYTGKTALTVRGNITGKTYRFEMQDSRQLVDYRDASALMKIIVLRKIV